MIRLKVKWLEIMGLQLRTGELRYIETVDLPHKNIHKGYDIQTTEESDR